ncbi:MAG: hypothetical protein Q4C09_04270 [Atopobiaceae bacterium]|nr:hypothetical protein [Atopobiaceae bacterium]
MTQKIRITHLKDAVVASGSKSHFAALIPLVEVSFTGIGDNQLQTLTLSCPHYGETVSFGTRRRVLGE